jgi:SAM-dependent methyltransferase
MTNQPRGLSAQAAAEYDEHQLLSDADTAVAVAALVELAAGRPVLELAAGTGRVAIPLAQRGVRVVATDVSPHALAVLAAKDSDGLVERHVQDMATPGRAHFGLVALLLNSLFAAPSAEAQQRVFTAAHSWLQPDGLFVLECAVPNLIGRQPIERFEHPDGGHLFREILQWQPATQRVTVRFSYVRSGKLSENLDDLRWVWPAECDLRAAAAGLELRERWDNWEQRPFGPDSTWAISVYGKPTT